MFNDNGIIEELYKVAEAQGPEFSKAFYALIMCSDPRPLSLIRSAGEGNQTIINKLLSLAADKDEYALNSLGILTQVNDISEYLCRTHDLIRRVAPVIAPQNPEMTVAAATAPHLAEPVFRIITNTCWIPGVGKYLCENNGFRCIYSYLTFGQESLQCVALQALDRICTRGSKEDSLALITMLFDCGDFPGVMINLCTAPQTPPVQYAALCFCATLTAMSPRFCGGVVEVAGGIGILLRHATYTGALDSKEVECLSMERALCTLATLVKTINIGVAISGNLISAFSNTISNSIPGTFARIHAINALGYYSAYMEWNIENNLIICNGIGALVAAMNLAYPKEAYAAGVSLHKLLKASSISCGAAAVSAGIPQKIISFLSAKNIPLQVEEQNSGVPESCETDINYKCLGVHIAACLISDPAGMSALGSSQQALEVLVDLFTNESLDKVTKEEIVSILLSIFMLPDIGGFDSFMKIAGLGCVFNLLVSE